MHLVSRTAINFRGMCTIPPATVHRAREWHPGSKRHRALSLGGNSKVANQAKRLQSKLEGLITHGSGAQIQQLMRKCVWFVSVPNAAGIAEAAFGAITERRRPTTVDFEILSQLYGRRGDVPGVQKAYGADS